MKLLFTLSLMLVAVSVFAQPVTVFPFTRDSLTGGQVIREVVQTPGVSSAELYNRARIFAGKSFVSAKSVIDVDNREGGYLLLKVSMPASMGMNYYFPIEIRIKEGRYRYEISNLEVGSGAGKVNIDEEERKAIAKIGKEEYERKVMDFQAKRGQMEKAKKEGEKFLAIVSELKRAMSASAEKDF